MTLTCETCADKGIRTTYRQINVYIYTRGRVGTLQLTVVKATVYCRLARTNFTQTARQLPRLVWPAHMCACFRRRRDPPERGTVVGRGRRAGCVPGRRMKGGSRGRQTSLRSAGYAVCRIGGSPNCHLHRCLRQPRPAVHPSRTLLSLYAFFRHVAMMHQCAKASGAVLWRGLSSAGSASVVD